MEVAASGEAGYVVNEAESGVNGDAKVADSFSRRDEAAGYVHSRKVPISQTSLGPEPDDLSLRWIEQQPVSCHPDTYILNAVDEAYLEGCHVARLTVIIDL